MRVLEGEERNNGADNQIESIMVKIKERLQAIHIKNLTNTKQINTKSTTLGHITVKKLENKEKKKKS